MRKEFCEKDGILITYTNSDVCFEDCKSNGIEAEESDIKADVVIFA